MCCCYCQGDDKLTRGLLDRLMKRKRIYLIAATFGEQLMIRFVVCSRLCQVDDIDFAWNEIRGQADELLLLSSSPVIPYKSIEPATEYTTKNITNITAIIKDMKIDKLTQKIS